MLGRGREVSLEFRFYFGGGWWFYWDCGKVVSVKLLV